MSRNLILVKQRHINANAKTIWDVLTAPTTDWNGIIIETVSDWKPNSDIVFSFVWDGKEYSDRGKIINFEPERLFTHTYWSIFSGLPDKEENYSIIQYELLPTKEGTILKLTHSHFATEIMYEHSDENWEDTLDKIKEECEATNR